MVGEVDAEAQDDGREGRHDADADDEDDMLQKLKLVDLAQHVTHLLRASSMIRRLVIFFADYSHILIEQPDVSFAFSNAFLHLRKIPLLAVFHAHVRLKWSHHIQCRTGFHHGHRLHRRR